MPERIKISISPEYIEVEIESDQMSSRVVEERAIKLIKDFIPKDTKSTTPYAYFG